uniref:Serine/arginine-rich splicing factor RSZ22-like n=1 Tax=Nicotiana tabacum TaxID=4097 RepID=A0A1S4AT05_TOBAC|nr:PREDICTED: serine/arginine-rich splicing factor RSZ22-like [Nicotiana tabacum]
MEREGSSRARLAGNLGDSFGGGRSAFRGGSSSPSQSYAQSSASAPPSGHGQQQGSRFRLGQGSRESHHQECYGCGMRGHIQRECRASRQGVGRGTTQSSSPTAATSSAHPPAGGYSTPAGRGTARDGAQSLGGPD